MGKDLKGKELGMGISQRKDGRYSARAIVNGVRIEIIKPSLSELRREFDLKKQEIQYQNNEYDGITVEKWYDIFYNKHKAPMLKNEASKRACYRKCKNTYIKSLAEKEVSKIKQADIQQATNELTGEYKTKTIREALSILRECFEIATLNDIIRVNPCQHINILNDNVKPEERRVLSLEEQKAFLKEAENSYYYEAYVFLLSSGLRIGEFSGLQWEDIDWINKTITIRRTLSTSYMDGRKIEQLQTPKTSNSYRTIPFFAETEKILKKWKEKQEEIKRSLGTRWRARPELGNLVFTSTMGSPVTRYVLIHDLQRIVENINNHEMWAAMQQGREPVKMSQINPHAFRHTFATRCHEQEINPLIIQRIMGHSNYSTTISYTHLTEKDMKKEAEKLKILSQI